MQNEQFVNTLCGLARYKQSLNSSPPRVCGSGPAAVALTVPLGHSSGTRLHKPPQPMPLGAVPNGDTQSIAPRRRGDGTALHTGDDHPGASNGKGKPDGSCHPTLWALLISADPPFWAAGGSRQSHGVQLSVHTGRKRIKNLQPDMSITKYLMYLFSKVGTPCAHCARMLSDNSSCKRSTQATQQNAAENYSSTSQKKLHPK